MMAALRFVITGMVDVFCERRALRCWRPVCAS